MVAVAFERDLKGKLGGSKDSSYCLHIHGRNSVLFTQTNSFNLRRFVFLLCYFHLHIRKQTQKS